MAIASTPTFAQRIADVARWSFLALSCLVVVLTAWLFGGMGPDGYYIISWCGYACALPLGLWLVSRKLENKMPRKTFWVPLVCWSLLAIQVLYSLRNESSVPQDPWVGDGFARVSHNGRFPSTAYLGQTIAEGKFWLALALFALTARSVALRSFQVRILLWAVAANASVLALAGIPFKLSHSSRVLGKWPAPEPSYFYSTFLYHNHWSAYAFLGLSSTAALFVCYQKRVIRQILAAFAISIAIAAPLSTSRLGTLSVLVFSGCAAFSYVRRNRPPKRKKEKTHRLISKQFIVTGCLVALFFIVAVGVVRYFYRPQAALQGRRSWSTIGYGNPTAARRVLLEDTLPMITEKPLFGWGLGAYGAAFRFYQRPQSRVVYNNNRITLYDHPHDDWLERLTELGVVGFVLLILPGAVWLIVRNRKSALMPMLNWMLFGCVGVMIMAFGDMVFVNRTVAVTFAILFPLATVPKPAQAGVRESLT